MPRVFVLPIAGLLTVGWGCLNQLAVCAQTAGPEDSASQVHFSRDVLPVLAEHCFACHGFDEASRQADLRLDTYAAATGRDGGTAAIDPGNPDGSELIARIFAADPSTVMPPPDEGKPLTASQKQTLRDWIASGGQYETHWAFVPPRPVTPPTVTVASHPIDCFIQSTLVEHGLSPAPRADPATLIRRLHLDLIGLPPTVAEIDAFVVESEQHPTVAYQSLVDRLLASPYYGERWARWWLDQARYADSNGYSVDAPRRIWLYRDWVIKALNDDMPFDQFTIEQLAGDLLPAATFDQQVATGFHRNTQINEEGGIDKEQFRIDSVFDRVATTGTVWLGLTIGCAQCHDHKFDPISQLDYYRMFAFFNNQEEPTLTRADKVTTLVLRELAEPRTTRLLIKGDFTRPATEVAAGTPAVLHPLRTASPSPSRLDLANWMFRPANPLTARVIVNRVWQQYFGRGIVEIENDFGTQGSFPSHPRLLDYLALQFSSNHWSLKQLHRSIVSSHAYQQSSLVRADAEQLDPANVLLARQQRLRLDAEIIRDVALAASGLLSSSIGGPPAFPPIPQGVMQQGQVARPWRTSTGADRYRRGLYTFKFRATPAPALNVFDAPDGFSSCTRRMRSNTPLQSLTMLNDPAFVEFAGALNTIIQRDGMETAFRHCTGRQPTSDERSVLSELDSFAAARTLLNLDETITRE